MAKSAGLVVPGHLVAGIALDGPIIAFYGLFCSSYGIKGHTLIVVGNLV